ncbi:SdpI family protein [Rhodococcus sp. X156]|uniref:SdpI family protein n=1 Tax=Rhodococcus sp. X156 TaxID=2499145 RepID=UPI000FD861F6|nr:SdpI family protein [Rhodococcus sp. X156]
MLDTVALVLAVLLVVAALALAAVALAGLLQRLPRNRWAGVRTPASLASDDAFRVANKVAAAPMLAAAAFCAVGAGALLGLDGWLRPVAVLVAVAAALVTAGAGGALGARAAEAAPSCAPEQCASCTGCSLLDARQG